MHELVHNQEFDDAGTLVKDEWFFRKKEVRVRIEGNPNEVRHDIRCPCCGITVKPHVERPMPFYGQCRVCGDSRLVPDPSGNYDDYTGTDGTLYRCGGACAERTLKMGLHLDWVWRNR